MPPPSRRNDPERAPLLDQEEESKIIPNYFLPLLFVSTATFLTGLLTVIGVFLLLSTHSAAPSLVSHHSSIPPAALLDGLRQCQAITSAAPKKNAIRVRNPRVRSGEFRPVVIENARVWDGDGMVFANVKVVLQDGLITEIGEDANIPSDAQIFDAKGHVVTPGLVDMHSHMGVDSWPMLDATSDTNEMTNPALPQLRSLDAFNPHDPAVRIIASGGVTTSLVLPGSGNLMGGEAYAFKHRHPKSHSAEEMLVNAGLDQEKDGERGWRWMKMACGENPKRVYGSENVMPSTRMGSAYLFRERLAQAREVLNKQDDWCAAAIASEHVQMRARFPEDVKQESLVALLRGRVKLNIHCYETHDIEMLIRTARENPGLEIAAFHHALDAYQIPEILRRLPNNVTIATFADHWGYKKEAFQASVRSPAELAAEGIPVALKSDHPVLNSQHLIYEAQKAHHYGLDEQLALAAVTSVPARAMGIGHRVGKLAAGYDADIVIWNKHPLSMGARPIQVFIDGSPLVDSNVDVGLDARDLVDSTAPPASENSAKPMAAESETSCTSKSTSFIVRNIGHIVMDKDQEYHSLSDTFNDQFQIVVEDGVITCAGIGCAGDSSEITTDSYDLDGGWVIPGIVGVAEGLGLVEIPPEHETSDGMRSSTLDSSHFSYAADGLQLGNGKHLAAAYKGGVTTGVVGPLAYNGLVKGWMVSYSTGAETVADETKPIMNSAVGLLLQIGQSGKDVNTPSISSQVSALRKLIDTCKNATDENLLLLASGDLPFVINTNSADSIAHILLIKNAYPSVNFVIYGGAEAYLLRKQLADAKIGVILNPPRCTMGTWETRRCLSGMPLKGHTGLDLLLAAGVEVALGVEEDGFARNLIWEAGWAQAAGAAHKLSDADAIGLVTWNVARILRLDQLSTGNMQSSPGTIRVGQRAEFVGFSSRPLEFGAKVQMVVGGGKTGVTCWPVQQ